MWQSIKKTWLPDTSGFMSEFDWQNVFLCFSLHELFLIKVFFRSRYVVALRFKSTKQLQQLETAYIITDAQVSLKHRTRVVAAFNPSGKVTSAGNILSDAPLVSLTGSWCMTVEDKRKLYGSMRIAVGGQTDQEMPRARPDSAMEPVSFHQTCKEVWQEIMQSETQCKAVIDLNATDILAWECVRSATPYLGVTFTEFHSEALTNRLAQLTFKMMMTEGSNLYRPSLAMLLKATAGGPQQEAAPAKRGTKRKTTKSERAQKIQPDGQAVPEGNDDKPQEAEAEKEAPGPDAKKAKDKQAETAKGQENLQKRLQELRSQFDLDQTKKK